MEIGLPCITSLAGGPLKRRESGVDNVTHRGFTHLSVAMSESSSNLVSNKDLGGT